MAWRGKLTVFASLILLSLSLSVLYANFHYSISQPVPFHSRPNTLTVSAFFPGSSSEHDLNHFLSQSSSLEDVYLYVHPSAVHLIPPGVRVNSEYRTPFDIPPLRGLEARYDEMRTWDQRDGHRPRVQSNAKAFWLHEALRAVGPGYERAYWVDLSMGNDLKLLELEEGENLFFSHRNLPHVSMRFWTDSLGPVATDFTDGSVFGGPLSSLKFYMDAFYAYHDHYLNQRVFVGDDESLTNALVLLFPHKFVTRHCLTSKTWWDWTPKIECGQRRDMLSILKERFGKGWTAPKASIEI